MNNTNVTGTVIVVQYLKVAGGIIEEKKLEMMTRTERILRCKILCGEKNKMKPLSRAIKYPVNYESLMAGEGGYRQGKNTKLKNYIF